MACRIYVAGGTTLIGSALVRRLSTDGRHELVAGPEPDLTDGAAVARFLKTHKPERDSVAAGETAGIAGNQRSPADLMLNNLQIGTNLISAAWGAGVERLLYFASSCVYPKAAPQPLSVASLWTGPVEPTSDAYAVAKLAGMRLCDAYRRQHGSRSYCDRR